MTKKKNEEKINQEEIHEEGMEQNQENAPEQASLETESDSLQAELDAIKLKSNENFEGWQRERADFLNYKKRVEREQASLKNFIVADIVKKYLAVLDDMELAFKNRPTSEDCQGWVEGIALIHQKLNSILENEGVEKIPAEGLEFDPNIHEAVTQIDSPNHESGMVVEVMRVGYKIGDRVIRPALVIIAR